MFDIWEKTVTNAHHFEYMSGDCSEVDVFCFPLYLQGKKMYIYMKNMFMPINIVHIPLQTFKKLQAFINRFPLIE